MGWSLMWCLLLGDVQLRTEVERWEKLLSDAMSDHAADLEHRSRERQALLSSNAQHELDLAALRAEAEATSRELIHARQRAEDTVVLKVRGPLLRTPFSV